MKFNSLIAALLTLLIFGSTIFIGCAGSNNPKQVNIETVQSGDKLLQASFPRDIAITKDGKYAYLSSDLTDAVFKVDLYSLSTIAIADLTEYFPLTCQHIALDDNEEKLFVYTPTWEKIIVIDTQTMDIIHIIDDINLSTLSSSQYTHTLIAPMSNGTIHLINTDTYEITQFTDNNVLITGVKESTVDPNKWYVFGFPHIGPPWQTVNVGIYDNKNKAWIFLITIPLHSENEIIMDFEVLPNEQKLYVATFGGWYPEYHGYGWLYSIDLTGAENLTVIPIDGSAGCIESSFDSKWLYVGTGWPIPNDYNLLVVDTQSDNITGQIFLGTTKYGWHYLMMNKLQIDAANPNLLYGTVGDANAFIKVNLDNLTLIDTLVLNEESFSPRFFVKQPMHDAGYIPIQGSSNAFKFNIENAIIEKMVEFPNIRNSTGGYDIAIDDKGKLFIAQGEAIIEVNAEDMMLTEIHSLPSGIGGFWRFILSNDQTELCSIWSDPVRGNGYADTFLAIGTSDFQVDARIGLDGGVFNDKPFQLPNSSKLYALGGMPNGAVVIQVINITDFTIQKTITFNETGLSGISAGPYYPFSYDSSSHTLFVGATNVVLAIDTQTDEITKVISLADSIRTIGIEPGGLSIINAVGLVYNPQENFLYIANLDRSFLSIYNLTSDQFLPLAIPLEGYFPSYLFASDDFNKIYCLMSRSDSISVIDVTSKVVEKVIDLHSSLEATTTMLSVHGDTKTYDVMVSSNSSVSMVDFDLSSKQISFKAMGSSFAYSFPFFCNVTFPNELLGGDFTVQVDGTPLAGFIRTGNGVHTSLYFECELQGAKNIQITGTEAVTPTPTPTPTPTESATTPATSQPSSSTHSPSTSPSPAVPEFSSLTIVMGLAITELILAVAYKKRAIKRQ